PTDHTANARGIVVTVDGPKPTDTQRHREGRGENGKQRTTAAPVRAHHESSAGKHHITAAHQSKEFLGRLNGVEEFEELLAKLRARGPVRDWQKWIINESPIRVPQGPIERW